MKIGFNANLLHGASLRGWNRYTINLLARLPAMGITPVLYMRDQPHTEHIARLPVGTFELNVAPPMRYAAFEQAWLPRQCGRDRVDLLHSPFNYGLPWSAPCPRVLTLHDTIDTVYHRRSWTEWLRPGTGYVRLAHWISRTRAEHVITVSEYSRDDIVKHLRVPRAKISVIAEAADKHFHDSPSASRRSEVRNDYRLRRPFLFYLGGFEQRKNVPFLLRAFAAAALPNVDLVLGGATQDAEKEALEKLAAELKVTAHVRLIGKVPDFDLPVLYSEALAFVYPSEYEGFGLQLCEAMAAGCPALAARATSLPEVLGTGGETFSLAGPAELVALLRRVASEGTFRDELARRSLARGKEFSWEATAQATKAVYERVLGVSPSHR